MQVKPLVRPLMFVGTASDVGKSILTTAFCRIFKQDGYTPAPFKGQNMSLNSYATPDGLEIGRAQAVQSEAAGIPCHTDMNPVLLKPGSDTGSQLIVHGKSRGNMSAADYFQTSARDQLFTEVKNAFLRLSSRYSPIVMEGAGSISELNLKRRDITNMRMAIAAGAATYLITDIDRGGIFASLYGTMALLEPAEKACIKGIIINKFRGDLSLFETGKKMIEDLCGIPVTGIIPWYTDIRIEEEDSVSLRNKPDRAMSGMINIGVIRHDRIANFTDFDHIGSDSRVNLYFSNDPAELARADILVLPGSKNTIDDLILLCERGIDTIIHAAKAAGKTVIGICGGYQMLGETIEDPLGMESSNQVKGLGIFPVNTVLEAEKTSRPCSFTFLDFPEICEGYEIHLGRTVSGIPSPLATLNGGNDDGYYLDATCWGTYIHGILDNEAVINFLLASFSPLKTTLKNYKDMKDLQYDRLAAHVRGHIDMDQIYTSLTD